MADTAISEAHGLAHAGNIYYNLKPPALYEEAIRRGEAQLVAHGPLAANTGRFTGRSPKDKFIVKDATTRERVNWGLVNQALNETQFATFKADMESYMHGRDLFVQDLYVGTDPQYRYKVRVITEYAWHSLFAYNMFVRPTEQTSLSDTPDYTVIDLPGFRADPTKHGGNSDTLIAMNLTERLTLVANTEYAGEIKKSVFSAMNFELPARGVMPMHCSANHDENGKVALFFGLSGTGKTTLSADASRTLIGDDEHGWSDEGVFNFEGGCYAKVINLSPEGEPEIYATTRRFGTIVENIGFDPESREIDFSDTRRTENTRASYPIDFIPNASETGRAGQPNAIVFLTADAFGVLPPISRLTTEGAMYHFLSGYTAKVAGTERGITEPKATFSTCFGAPFMPLEPNVYAELLGEKIRQYGASVWLVNTGWSGGPYGVGSRMKLAYTRAMVKAAINGELDNVSMTRLPQFNLMIPQTVPGVPSELLNPRDTWSDKDAYDAQAEKLIGMFRANFQNCFAANIPETIIKAGPA